jgi:acetyl esterase/lipase
MRFYFSRDRYIRKMLNEWKENDSRIFAAQKLPENITEITDISYIADENKEHLLDIYYPNDREGPFPAIIDIHGGGFIYGNKELNKLFAYNLAKEGFIIFNINYRLAYNGVKVPDQIGDVINAMDWVGKNIGCYPACKDKIYLTGESAGAYLAVMAVLISNSERLQNIFNLKKPDININALGLISGYMEWTSPKFLYRSVRPMILEKGYKKKEYYKNMILSEIPEIKSLPPVFLTSNEDDNLDFMTFYFINILKESNVEHEFIYFKKNDQKQLGHVFNLLHLDWEESKKVNRAMLDYLSKF